MRVQIGKGIELDVNTSKFNATVTEHVMYMGLRNILMDSHANHTKDADGDEYVTLSRETAQNKLNALYNGEVRVAGTRSSDPVATQMRALAIAHAKKSFVAAGRKLRDVESKDITAEANKLLAKNEAALRKIAERMVKAASELELDMEGVV
jgi:hypothetical protein